MLQEYDRKTVLQDAVAEYKRLLAFQKLDELRAIARRWSLKLHGGNKASIIDQLGDRFRETHTQEAVLAELDDIGHQVLAYMHLLLEPEYGLSADSIVRGILHQRQRAVQPAHTAEPLLGLYNEQWQRDVGLRQKIQDQIAELTECGLVLPFRQNGALYYTLPNLVRFRLPARPSLVSVYTGDAEALRVDETTFGSLIHKLFTVWNALGHGIPGTDGPPIRPSPPPRQPIENQWSLLRGWDHEPSEISVLMRNQYSGGRSSSLRLDRVSAATLNWAMTVPAPFWRLRDSDREYIRRQVGGTDDQIEFYYALLEGLGALSGAPGEPIVLHNDAMQHFLRLSTSAKLYALWRAWIGDLAWSEMSALLRRDGQSTLRLRRSLAQHDYKAEDLYQEWSIGRKIILRFLTLLPDGQWLSIDGLLKTIFDVYPNLLHTMSDPSVWWLESPRTGRQFGTAFEDWQQSYGQFVLSMLQGPMNWLGALRLGYTAANSGATSGAAETESKTPVAFQLTDTGLFVLGRRSKLGAARVSSSLPDESCCTVSPDLTVAVVPDCAPLELHNLLHGVGRLVEARPDRFIYQLTAEGVSSWLEPAPAAKREPPESKTSIEALIALLDKHCHTPSRIWAEKLRTWERNRGLLHIYENMTLIELADEYALQELLISTSLGDSVVYQFSPRLVAIWAEGMDDLVKEMEKHGYTPRIQ